MPIAKTNPRSELSRIGVARDIGSDRRDGGVRCGQDEVRRVDDRQKRDTGQDQHALASETVKPHADGETRDLRHAVRQPERRADSRRQLEGGDRVGGHVVQHVRGHSAAANDEDTERDRTRVVSDQLSEDRFR